MTKKSGTDFDIASRCNCARLRRAARMVTRFYDQCLAPAGIGANQLTILGYLKHRGPLRMQALAELLAMDRATISHNLKPLERDGYVSITVDPADQRARLVSITKTGLAKVAEARPHWDLAQSRFESAFGPTESARLRHMLDHVAEQSLAA
ncbi:Transcriptional activatory protein BadR [Serratia plymuthica]|uniref:MarR family winged helix-turn-helix transcriptional regulator n=1 Tax=Serratia plymuthica TaxID=82996 RepID=UPI000787E90F|nr:MarR family winged helix-turn-helix transcriptional regulator [Serratia plymuthica]QJW56465.1 Transcriptional activatory protein BadR [Serratia plymuthica]